MPSLKQQLFVVRDLQQNLFGVTNHEVIAGINAIEHSIPDQ